MIQQQSVKAKFEKKAGHHKACIGAGFVDWLSALAGWNLRQNSVCLSPIFDRFLNKRRSGKLWQRRLAASESRGRDQSS